jgi:hypothetical protein
LGAEVNAQANPGIDFAQAQRGYHENAGSRRTAREALTKALRAKAQGEHDYRKGLAVAYTRYRNEGKGQGEAEILAKADAAGFALTRDMADADAKAAQARLAELEGERASLRQLIDWTREES